jgi:hypothetical protein
LGAAGELAALASTPANLYAAPDLASAIVGTVQPGQVLDIVALHTTGAWFLLTDGSWILTVGVENPPSALPLVVPTPTPLPTATPTPIPPAVTAAPTPQPTPIPLATSLEAPVCDCSADQFECLGSSFPNQAEAQTCFEYCFRIRGFDVHNLDPNGNGQACENLQ